MFPAVAEIEPHILKTAQRMLDRYEDRALQEVELRIRELQEHGEENATELWTKVRAAIRKLLDREPGDRQH